MNAFLLHKKNTFIREISAFLKRENPKSHENAGGLVSAPTSKHLQDLPPLRTMRPMPSRVWSPADALAFRCPVDSVGFVAPHDVMDPAPPPLPLGEEVQRRAVFALLRMAEQCDGRVSLEAARELLRLYPIAAPASGLPDWVRPGVRYAPAGVDALEENGRPVLKSIS